MISVRMRGISQRFGPVYALQNVDLEVESGTIHGIVGENGAGKTTLMRILYGVFLPTSGEVEINGSPVRLSDSKAAIAAGVGMVSQHYGIVPELSCLQNLILGAEGGAILDLEAQEKRAQALADRMGFSFDWHADAADLTPAGAQKLEILKLLWREAKIMILDEPTAMLSPADATNMFESMRKLAKEGATILLVTHRLSEVMENCQRVTVLRDGNLVADVLVGQTSKEELTRWIVGGDIPIAPSRSSVGSTAPMLSLSGVSLRGDHGTDRLRDIRLIVQVGEIVGVAGVDGSGQRELVQAILGIGVPSSGTIELTLDGRTVDISNWSTAARIEAGLRLIPEDRHEEGVVEDWSLEENAGLGLHRMPQLRNGGLLNISRRREWAEQVARRFNTKHPGLGAPMAALSGGNQQRFVAARALEMGARFILAFQPARGLDLGATADVYRALREKCDAGASALVVSFDLDELLEYTDRVVVMNGGSLREPPPELARDREAIGRLMVGAA